MQKRYSYYGSKLTLLLDERTADAHNRVGAEFYRAQMSFREKHGVQWTPDQPLELNLEPEDLAVWNAMAGVFDALNELNKFYPVDYGEVTEDYLVPLD